MMFSASVDSAVFDFAQVMDAQCESIKPSEDSGHEVIYLGVDSAGAGRDYAAAVALRELKEEGQNHL